MRAALIGVLIAGLVAAAAGHALSGAGGAAAATASPCSTSSKVPTYRHIVVIAFENHSYQSVLGPTAPASYFKTLAAQCSTATNYRAASFPHSLPNYLAATGANTGTITGDCLPSNTCEIPTASIFNQLGGTGWQVWSQSMPTPCATADAGAYAVRHNPAAYYPQITSCAKNDTPLPAATPTITRRFTWITPDLSHDMTQDSQADAGAWLKAFLTGANGLLVSRPYTLHNTAVFIWFDSPASTDTATTSVPLIVVAPSTGHRSVTAAFSDYALLKAWESMLGLGCLNQACTARYSVTGAFHL